MHLTEAEDFYSSYIANCVFNSYLCYTAVILNIITILALRKTSSLQLPTPLKTLLLSLAVSDLGVGLLVQPLYIAHLVMTMKQNTENNPNYNSTFEVLDTTSRLFCYASLFGVTALTADRFLAIHLHLRYKELVTHKRVVAVVILIWVSSAFVAALRGFPADIQFFLFVAIQIVCYISTAFFYCKIYLAVRHHINQQAYALQLQQVAQNGAENGEMASVVRLRKSAVGTFYVYLVFLACYLPFVCIAIVEEIGTRTTLLRNLKLYAFTLVFLNSSLNPLIYSWKMRHIRHNVINILRNIFQNNN